MNICIFKFLKKIKIPTKTLQANEVEYKANRQQQHPKIMSTQNCWTNKIIK